MVLRFYNVINNYFNICSHMLFTISLQSKSKHCILFIRFSERLTPFLFVSVVCIHVCMYVHRSVGTHVHVGAFRWRPAADQSLS